MVVLFPSRGVHRRRQWQPTPVLLPGKSHGRRSLVGCSPWGHEESDTTERLHFHSSLSCIGEGNGNPLQCSCLENPRGGGAWWAAVYGVRVRHNWSDLAAAAAAAVLITLHFCISLKMNSEMQSSFYELNVKPIVKWRDRAWKGMKITRSNLSI